jgi:hypothetical protein
MEGVVHRVLETCADGAVLIEVDVREHPELERRYLFEIPVLLLGDVEVVRHRTTSEDLRRRLTALGVSVG